MPTTRPALVLTLVLASAGLAADGPTGEQLFKRKCASCHGADGQGSKENPKALAGDKPLAELTKVVQKTMPEDDPGTLSMDDAAKVTAYVYESFYSPDAQLRNKPPRVELSRLTVRQYRNALADLVGSFRPPAKVDDRRGLMARYFRNRRMQTGQHAIERIDPEVRFAFGTDSPGAELEPANFSIRWEGAILAPETGEYEFTIRTDHAGRLWVNDPIRPLIDAWVKSGTDTEHKGSIFLLGGQPYYLRLEFSKATQGVNNQKKTDPPKPVRASVALLWKRPRGGPEVIPTRLLSPAKVPEGFVCAVPFPPDDRSLGWERGSAVSKAWDQATTDGAIEAAGYVAARLDELTGLRAPRDPGENSGNPASIRFDRDGGPKVPAEERARKAREFAGRFVERAFRRPLTPEQKALFVDRQFEAAPDPEVAVKRVVLLALKSPRFLYRETGTASDGFAVAERLAFALWDSLPDPALLAAAGKLTTRDEVARHATRMLSDGRAKAKVREFLLTWLKVEHVPDVAKDPKRFPGFDHAIASDLRTSLELFLDDVAWSESSDFRQLLLAEDVYLNGRLAMFYGKAPAVKFFGVNLLAEVPFQKMKLDGDRRAGILTHPYLMASFAYTGTTSPIHRGVFLARGVLGRSLRPPQEAFTPLPEDLHPTLTTRERVHLQTKSDNCQACHGLINPLGFTLEHFDAIGRYREKDNNKPVEASGSYRTRTGETVTFLAARDLAKFLAQSEEVHGAFAEQLFHHLVQQPVRAYGPGAMADLRKAFAADGYNIRKLAVTIALTAALPPEKVKPKGG